MPSLRKLATLAAMLALALTAPSAQASGNGGVLVVGDSLEELTSPYLKQYLPGVPLTVNAVGGYNSFQIFDLFEESYDPSQSVIVFDAGTNDNPAYPEILAGNLQQGRRRPSATAAWWCRPSTALPSTASTTPARTGRRGLRRLAAGDAGARLGAGGGNPPRADAGRRPAPDRRRRRPARAPDRARGSRPASASPRPPAAKPALESGPNLPPARKLARREAELVDSIIGAALGLFPISLAERCLSRYSAAGATCRASTACARSRCSASSSTTSSSAGPKAACSASASSSRSAAT